MFSQNVTAKIRKTTSLQVQIECHDWKDKETEYFLQEWKRTIKKNTLDSKQM